MDFHSMKRKELQALCKKNNIRANLTNLEMANKLSLLLKEKEKPATRRRCLKNTEDIANENNNSNVVARQSKKVKFSPEHEIIIFGDDPVGITRSRAQKSVEGSELPFISPPPQKKRTRKAVGVHGMEVKDGNRDDKTPPETRVPIRKSLRIKEVMGENQKEGEQNNPIQRSPRKRKAKGIEEISESNGLPGDDEIGLTDKPLRRSKRSLRKLEDFKQLNEELSKCETVGKGKFTRPQTELTVEVEVSDVERETGTETKTDVSSELEVVLQLEEHLRRTGRNGNRRKSVIPQNEKVGTNGLKDKNESRKLSGFPENQINGKGRATRSGAKVEEESEEGVQFVEISRNPVRKGNRRKSVRWQIDEVGTNGPTAENESTELSKGSTGEGRSIAEIPQRKTEVSLPNIYRRRTRRETSMFNRTIPTDEELGTQETVSGYDSLKESSAPFVESVYTEKGAEIYASECASATEKVDILTEVDEEKSCEHYIPEVNDDDMALQSQERSGYRVEKEPEEVLTVANDGFAGITPVADRSSPVYQSHYMANLENILDLGKELETYEKPFADEHMHPSCVMAHGVDSVPKGQNLEEGDGFGEQMHKLVVGGHLAECNRSEGSKLSSENFSEEDEDASPTRLKDKDMDETEKCFSRTKNMVVTTPLTEKNPALSSSKVSENTKNECKCSPKKSSLEKQCSPMVVSFKSPDLEGIRDVSEMKTDGTPALSSFNLESDSVHQKTVCSVKKSLAVEKKNILPVGGNENLLQSDIHKGNDYDFESQSQKESVGFDCKSSVELEPFEELNEVSEVVGTITSSSGDCFSPLHQLNHLDKGTDFLADVEKEPEGASEMERVVRLVNRETSCEGLEENPCLDGNVLDGLELVEEEENEGSNRICVHVSEEVMGGNVSELPDRERVGHMVSEEGDGDRNKEVLTPVISPEPSDIVNNYSISSFQCLTLKNGDDSGANLDNILDLGKELETYEKPFADEHINPSCVMAHEVDYIPMGQNLEEGDGFGEPMHELVVGGHLAECNLRAGSELSSENFSEEDEEVHPTRLKDKDMNEPEECFSRTRNMVVKNPLTKKNPALSCSKVSENTKNEYKCSPKKSSLEKQCSPMEVSFKSPDLVGVRDVSEVKTDGTPALSSFTLESDSVHQKTVCSVKKSLVVEKENILLVGGNENLLQSDIHKGNDFDFASQSQKESVGFDCKSSLELEPVENLNEISEVITTNTSSSSDCFSPLHQLNHLDESTNILSTGEELKTEDPLQYNCSHPRGISVANDSVGEDNYPAFKGKNLPDYQDDQRFAEPSTHERNCGNASKKASEISPLDISGEGITTMNIVEGNIEEEQYSVEAAKLWENLSVSYSAPAKDAEEKVTDVELTSGNYPMRTTLLSPVVASECHVSQLDNEVTHSIGCESAGSFNKDERQQDTETYDGSMWRGETFFSGAVNGMCNEERIEESLADMEKEPEGALEMERAVQPVNQETSCEGIEGNPCMDGNVNEVELELAEEKENEASNRLYVHVYEAIMGGSVSELPLSDTHDQIKEVLTPIITPESSDIGNNESISTFQCVPLKNDDSGEDELKILVSTPAKNVIPAKEESCSRETELAGVSTAKDSLQKVVRAKIGEYERIPSTVNALPSSDEDSNKNVEEITNALPTFDIVNNESMSFFQCVPLKNNDDSGEDGLKLLFATPPANNANPSKEESCCGETEMADVSMTEDLLQEVRTKRSEHKTKSYTGNTLPTFGEEIFDEDSNKNVDTEHTQVIGSIYSEIDDSIFKDGYVADDKESGCLEQNFENASSEHTCVNVLEVPAAVQIPPIASEERENDVNEDLDLDEAIERNDIIAEFHTEVAGTNRKCSEDIAPCTPSYAPEHQASEEMLYIMHMLSTSSHKQDRVVTEGRDVVEGMVGDHDVEFGNLATGDEKEEVLSEVEFCVPVDCNEEVSPVNDSTGVALTETIDEQTKASEDILTEELIITTMGREESRGACSPLDSDEVSLVKNGILLEHGQVDSGGPSIHIDEIVREKDMNASMESDKLTYEIGNEDLGAKSHGSDETRPQVDQVKFAVLAGQEMELMVQDVDNSAFLTLHQLSADSEDSDDPQEAPTDVTVTETVLQGHETKHGDINNQIILGITDGNTNIMDENSNAENKEENVPVDFDYQLEIEKVQNSASFSQFNHGDENESHIYQENLRVPEDEEMTEVVPDEFEEPQKFGEDSTSKPAIKVTCAAISSDSLSILGNHGSATEDTQKQQSNSDSVQRRFPTARAKDNSPSPKQLNSMSMKRKTLRTSLVQSTPKKLITMLDMKENAPSIKREDLGTVKTAKTVSKRRALEDIQKR